MEKSLWCSYSRVSLMTQTVQNLAVMQDTWVLPLGWADPWRKEWLPTPVFLPGEVRRQRSMGPTVLGVTKSQTLLSTDRAG